MSNTSLQLLCWTVSLFPSLFLYFCPLEEKTLFICIADSSAHFIFLLFQNFFHLPPSPLENIPTPVRSSLRSFRENCVDFYIFYWEFLIPPCSLMFRFSKKKLSTSHMICYFNIFIGMPFDVFSLLKQEGTLHSHVLNFIPFSFPPFRNTRTLDLNPHLLCFVHLYKEWNNDWTVQPISYPSSL